MSYENVEIETRGKVGIIRLNRPQALNALNSALIADLSHAVDAFEASDAIGCIVITGPGKPFAAARRPRPSGDNLRAVPPPPMRSTARTPPRISPRGAHA